MRVKSIKIKNVGLHEDLVFNCDVPIVGVLGINGSGKSTLLSMLRYGIAGALDLKKGMAMADLVTHGKENGSVQIEFEKNGRNCEIFRQFGKSARRWMTLDGIDGKLTKVAEIEQALTDLFGADRKAMTNAVFIPQGGIEAVLFADYAKRRDMFIKIVNLAFCEQRVREIEAEREKLKQTVEDLGPKRDAATTRLTEAEQRLKIAQQEATECPDFSDLQTKMGNYKPLLSRIRTLAQAQGELDQQLVGKRAAVEALRVELQSYEATRDSWETELENATADQTRISNAKVLITARAQKEAQITTLENKARNYTSWCTQLAQLTPDWLNELKLDDWSPVPSWIQGWITYRTQEANHGPRKDAAQQAYDSALKTHEEWKVKYPAAWIEAENKKLDAINKLVDEKQRNMQNAEQQAKLLKQLQGGEAGATCATCQLHIPASAFPDLPGTIASMESMGAQMRQEWQENYRKSQELNQTLQSVFEAGRASEELVKTTGEELARVNAGAPVPPDTALNKVPNTATVEQLTAWFNNVQQAMQVLIQIRQAAGVGQELEQAKQDLAALAVPDVEVDIEVEQQAAQRVSNARTAIQNIVDKGQEYARAGEDLATAEEQWRLKGQELVDENKASELLAQEIADHPLWQVLKLEQALDFDNDQSWTQAEQQLRFRMAQRNEKMGAATEAASNVDVAKANLSEVLERIGKQERTMELLEDLTKMRDLFNSEGLPLAAVQYHFDKLARLTQTYLSRMGARFVISLDREESLGLNFQKIDDDEAPVLPVTLASGGERVRLCVAFLLAVQEWLASDIGLLSLDEPSVHLDEEGVRHLGEMLQEISRGLRSADMQIWVCDHNPLLQQAFSKSLTLGAPRA